MVLQHFAESAKRALCSICTIDFALVQVVYQSANTLKTLELIKYDVSSLAGVSGQVFVDENGDRTITLQMRNFHNGEMVRVANYFRHLEELEFTDTTTVWPGGSVTAPLGRPECGFNGEFCSSPGMMMPIFPV